MSANDFNFVETDSARLYNIVIGFLMDSCNEPLYPGDERRNFGEALVAVFVALYSEFNDKMKQRTLRYARGQVLDAIGERYGVLRAAPAPASATFRFSVSSLHPENIIIPKGTKITADSKVYFETVKTVVLQAGTFSVDVDAVCTESGTAHNGYVAGTIKTLVDLIPFVGSVENTTTTSGGDDGEAYDAAGDERLRERIRLAPATQTTAGPESAYRYFAMTADPEIIDIAVESPSPNVINIYPLMQGGTIPDEATLDAVLAAFPDDVRPMSDQVSILPPSAVEYDIEIKYYCSTENEADTIKAVEADGGAVDRYVEWQSAALGRSINPDQLRKLILCPDWDSSLVGADRVEVVSPSFQSLDKTQVAKFSGTLKITHEVTT